MRPKPPLALPFPSGLQEFSDAGPNQWRTKQARINGRMHSKVSSHKKIDSFDFMVEPLRSKAPQNCQSCNWACTCDSVPRIARDRHTDQRAAPCRGAEFEVVLGLNTKFCNNGQSQRTAVLNVLLSDVAAIAAIYTSSTCHFGFGAVRLFSESPKASAVETRLAMLCPFVQAVIIPDICKPSPSS